jgi:ArsR family transcriptional regulator
VLLGPCASSPSAQRQRAQRQAAPSVSWRNAVDDFDHVRPPRAQVNDNRNLIGGQARQEKSGAVTGVAPPAGAALVDELARPRRRELVRHRKPAALLQFGVARETLTARPYACSAMPSRRIASKSLDMTTRRCYGLLPLLKTRLIVMTSPLSTLPAGPAAEACCAPSVGVDTSVDAERVAIVAKALAEPLRVHILDVLRRSETDVCQCELIALFDIKQSLLSHHIKKLVDAGLVNVERRHKWAYYSVSNDALKELTAWLS